MAASSSPRLIDIGSNLGDPVFRGLYRGKQSHPDDFLDILSRARQAGVVGQILTGDRLSGSEEVFELAKEYDGLYCTVGCHPCRAQELEADPKGYIESLAKLIEHNIGGRHGKGKVVAIGECGLDYDRLELCPKNVQLKHFPPQLELATRFDLPLFLHSRAAHEDFVNILKAHGKPLKGVVHSFDGTPEQAKELIDLGFYIGINGCSLKTDENLSCVASLPLTSLMVESDCPYCEIRPSHSSSAHLKTLETERPDLKDLYLPVQVKKEKWVKGKAVRSRNEPCSTGAVAWVVAKLKGVEIEEVAEVTYKNTVDLFGLDVADNL